jgi:ketosteroid isomerase-like protein
VGVNADLVARVYEAFARRDLDGVREVVHPDVEFHAPTARIAGVEGPYTGHEGMREYFEDVARVWQDVRPEPRAIHELPGDRVLVLGRVYAWGAGRVIDAPAAWVWQLRDGRIAYGRVHESTRTALDELGLDEVPGGSGD